MDRRKARRIQHRAMAYLALALGMGQMLLALVSWVLTAAMPGRFVHSLLSAEGIRWFMGRFVGNMQSPLLVWLVLAIIAVGTLQYSGLLHYRRSEYRQRVAMRFAVAAFVLCVLVMLALTVVPHAILLNVMGRLYPSSFSQSIVPYCCLSLVIVSLSYGVMTGRIHGVVAVYEAMVHGMRHTGGILLLYVLAMQLYCSVLFLLQ